MKDQPAERLTSAQVADALGVTAAAFRKFLRSQLGERFSVKDEATGRYVFDEADVDGIQEAFDFYTHQQAEARAKAKEAKA